jgi:CHASE3 domain sensor protein
MFGLAVLIAVIYKLLNHKDKTPDPLDKLEADANTKLAEAEQAVKAKMDEVLHVAETAVETLKATTKPENMSDAEWAMSDKNPNRVEVAPVVVTVDSPSAEAAPEVVAEVAPVKKPRVKKAAASKAKKAK